MTADLAALCEASVALERSAGQLYALYADLYPEDADFWRGLQIEEENHASIVKTMFETYVPLGLFPRELLDPDLDSLRAANGKVLAALARFREHPPAKRDAYVFAVELEESSGEMYYQEAMVKNVGSEILQIVRQVNNNDKDHAIRIRAFMEEQGLG
ncbi:MAG: rubrerythrin family protein [Kiritimatiellae bacterium]|nr:rubrerythrin family protein [Kiritimatiellia bacterium]